VLRATSAHLAHDLEKALLAVKQPLLSCCCCLLLLPCNAAAALYCYNCRPLTALRYL
jgi:hypothetical protein